MLHTSGLVTIYHFLKSRLGRNSSSFMFVPILTKSKESLRFVSWATSLLKWLNISQWIQRCSVIPTHYGQDLKSLWIAWSETI